MKTPLSAVTITCCECGEDADAQSINDDKVRYHLPAGNIARFPAAGLTSDQIARIPSFGLRCEVCHEDQA
jgi:hypothetical protein